MKKLRKGDTVIILTGENKTKKGIIYKIYKKKNKALLQNGSEILINISNISFLKKVKYHYYPIKIGFKIDKKGQKQRVSKKTGKIIN
ncbi:putative 50S ribosomal protein L24 [Candidatus Sulcia muelleri SMDSEM]|uniref:Putative 50S ribosomal protein L24 n=1 Tax=Karelsulcia muelleri (strain SMDSEM) TaxID=595499 RepID=C7LKI0_KARMS|nr:putative 50S ribosomal protein L24 [Candidatus Karelsulcia muelleri SMDSEM]